MLKLQNDIFKLLESIKLYCWFKNASSIHKNIFAGYEVEQQLFTAAKLSFYLKNSVAALKITKICHVNL